MENLGAAFELMFTGMFGIFLVIGVIYLIAKGFAKYFVDDKDEGNVNDAL
ncbi:OadG-related small transporter subunit [Fundicoccus culcitae]|nr:OadG-related small transporter subunit [Fundicoccus culcitae]